MDDETRQNNRSPTEVLHVTLKQMFGLSDHTIQRILHLVGNAGELVEVQRRVREIPSPILNQLLKNIHAIETDVAPDIQLGDNNVDDSDDNSLPDKSKQTVSMSLESKQTFKTFLINELDASSIQAAKMQAAGQGLATKAERRQAGQLSDRDFIQKQAEERDKLQQSSDPLDRRILQLKKQLDILMKQKAAKERQNLPR